MPFVLLGVVLCGLKLLGWTMVAGWSWWLVLAPFLLAALWWQFADTVGITQRGVMQREQARAARRREEQYEKLGLRAGPVSPGRRSPKGPRD